MMQSTRRKRIESLFSLYLLLVVKGGSFFFVAEAQQEAGPVIVEDEGSDTINTPSSDPDPDNDQSILKNTPCDISPDALTNSLQEMNLVEDLNINNTQVQHTCIDSTTYPGKRCFYTYVPDCATSNSPLVYDIHGVSLCPHWNFETTLWIQKAIENCFVIAWPVGNVQPSIAALSCFALTGGYGPIIPPSTPPTKNYTTGDCCCFGGPQGTVDPAITDDLTFLRNVAAVVVDQVPEQTQGRVTIDTKRIYMGGHSNGCSAGLSMAAVHSDMVAAVCCHSPALITDVYTDPIYRAVPTFIVHGRMDGTVLYDGWFPRGEGGSNYNPGAQQVNQILGTANECDANYTDKSFDGGFLRQRTDCTNNNNNNNNNISANVELFTIDTAGHTPFLGADLFPRDLDGAEVTTIDTTQAAWEFCSQHARDTEPELVLVQPPSSQDTEAPETNLDNSNNNNSSIPADVPQASTASPTVPTASGALLVSSRVILSMLPIVVIVSWG